MVWRKMSGAPFPALTLPELVLRTRSWASGCEYDGAAMGYDGAAMNPMIIMIQLAVLCLYMMIHVHVRDIWGRSGLTFAGSVDLCMSVHFKLST